MKTSKTTEPDDEMLPEYDFSKAERGKFYKPLNKGYSTHVHQADGTTVINHYTLAEGTVLLEPDVRAVFPDSESVNAALRSLIDLMGHFPKTKPYPRRPASPRQVAEKK
jgi:hypothetical protein